jgi:hypothetical protein
VIGVFGRDQPVWRRAFWVVGAYLVATPNLYPWYVLWIVPLLAFQPTWPWLYLSLSVGLTYLLLAQPVWHLPSWVSMAEFGPFAIGLLLAWRPCRHHTSRAALEAARP